MSVVRKSFFTSPKKSRNFTRHADRAAGLVEHACSPGLWPPNVSGAEVFFLVQPALGPLTSCRVWISNSKDWTSSREWISESKASPQAESRARDLPSRTHLVHTENC